MAGSFPLDLLIERLQLIGEIRLIELVGDFEDVLATPPRTFPAVSVSSSSVGRDIKFSGPPLQQDRETAIHLLIWITNAGGAVKAAADLRQLEESIDRRLAGWSPGDAFASVRFAGSKDEFAEGSIYARQLKFTCPWTFAVNIL